MRSGVRAVIFLILGAGVLLALLAYVGLAVVIQAIREASPLYLALAFVAYCLFFLFRGLRWKLLFGPTAPHVRLASTTSVSAVGWLANSVLPFKSGDLLRAALIARHEKVGLAASAATVGLERVLDLLGLAVVAAIGLLILPRAVELPGGLERALAVAWMLPLVALALLAWLVHARKGAVRAVSRLLHPFGKVGRKLVDLGDSILAGFAALVAHPRILARLAPLTIAVALTQALVFTFLVLAFVRTPSVFLAFSGSAIFLLSFVVSITPGNLGTYEAAFSAVFIGLGVPPEVAVPAGVLTHVATTFAVAILGGVGLYVLGTANDVLVWRASPSGQVGR